jgi:hypothetical protein
MKSPNDKKRFLEALEEIPIVSIASKRTGIAKSTIYRWKDRDVKFAKKMEEYLWRGRDSVTDKIESQLIKQADQGQPWAIKLWLGANCKRYVKPRMDNIFLADDDRLQKIIVEVLKTREITQKEQEELNGKLDPTKIIFEDFSDDKDETKGS